MIGQRDPITWKGEPDELGVSDKIRATKKKVIVMNQRVSLPLVNWDKKAKEQIESGEGFRITEPGKTDINTAPGYYSIHSPLYGTDYSDEDSFADRYQCKCGYYQGRHYADGHTVCPLCHTKVEFVGVNMKTTGWIILDRDQIIQSTMFKKLWDFIGKNRFLYILEYKDPSKRNPTPDNPFVGIGMIEFRHRYREILDFFFKKKTKASVEKYMFLIEHEDLAFTHSIPVYSMHLRQFVIIDDKVKYSDDDKLFRKIYSNHNLLNDRFLLQQRRINRDKRERARVAKGEDPTPGTVDYLRRENILFSIQMDLDKLWEYVFRCIDKKEGFIQSQISGGRQNYTARNVIVPGPTLRQDEIGLGYITFLELNKFEIIRNLMDYCQISLNEASNIHMMAAVKFDPNVYYIMQNMIKRKIYVMIGRNPSINDGSLMGMKVKKISKDITDYCMELPELILAKPNADFDGDVMYIVGYPIRSMAKEVYDRTNPSDNLIISRNDGLLDKDSLPKKDNAILYHAAATCFV